MKSERLKKNFREDSIREIQFLYQRFKFGTEVWHASNKQNIPKCWTSVVWNERESQLTVRELVLMIPWRVRKVSNAFKYSDCPCLMYVSLAKHPITDAYHFLLQLRFGFLRHPTFLKVKITIDRMFQTIDESNGNVTRQHMAIPKDGLTKCFDNAGISVWGQKAYIRKKK